MRSRCSRRFLGSLPLALVVIVAAGCEEPRYEAGKPRPQAKKKAEPEDTFIVGKRTTEIGRADDPALKKGAQIASGKITAKDPITIHGNAYVVSIDKIAKMNIQHTMDLYHAANDRYPADYDEFKKVIIEENGLSLPMLPHYQKYVYDEKKHELLVYEYPELKGKPPQP
jgi:hypothetical protein